MNSRERFVAACRGLPVDRPPVWLMRQAGRYLPEYRAIREKHSFWEMMRTPELSVEVTLQPIRRYGMDAAILFSDILIVQDALGAKVEYRPGGITITPKIHTEQDLATLLEKPQPGAFGYIEEALRRLARELHPEVALIGFAGAPFTLGAYLVDEGPSHTIDQIKALASEQPGLYQRLLERIADAVIELLGVQIRSGVDAVQIFDTWSGLLTTEQYRIMALPYTRRVVEGLKPYNVPVLLYVRNAAANLEAAAESGCNVLSIDTSLSLAEARARLGADRPLQGNFDPALLSRDPQEVRRLVHEMIDSTNGTGHIVNLGQGLEPESSMAGVQALVQAVKDWSRSTTGQPVVAKSDLSLGQDPRRIRQSLRDKYDVRGPRYTSYPPATHFHPLDNELVLARWRQQNGLADDPGLSLYVHVPFCQARCMFCGCHTFIGRRDQTETYLEALLCEMKRTVEVVDPNRIVQQLAMGGGTPNFLEPDQLHRLLDTLKRTFRFAGQAELSVEVDPRTCTPEKLDIYRQYGFNRFSLGIQDFSEEVLRRVRRNQGLMQVEEVVRHLRGSGCEAINFDLIYGLPGQSQETVNETVRQVVALRPSRIALYSYAHVPWIHPHQQVLEKAGLPTPALKASLFLLMMDRFLEAGYQAIGMDHFALPEDQLAVALGNRTLRRTFMGYTTGRGLDILGFGASAISSIGSSYSQNEKDLGPYQSRIGQGDLPIVRGFLLSHDDELRRELIVQLFCNFRADLDEIGKRSGVNAADYLAADLARLTPMMEDGLVNWSQNEIQVTEVGQFFIRNVCMNFDRYMEKDTRQQVYSRTV